VMRYLKVWSCASLARSSRKELGGRYSSISSTGVDSGRALWTAGRFGSETASLPKLE
jgi:hypothetical protein